MSATASSSGLFADSISAKAGLGYGIAIAVGILVLVSTIMLASYVCVRLHGRAAQSRRSQTQTEAGSDHQRHWSRQGLDEATLQSYPKIVYCEKNPLPPAKDASCSICLADYEDCDTLRLLPDCQHIFHAICIDAWLRLHVSCPMCRASPLPTPQSTPASTPLSELIPLARNPLSVRYTIHHNV